MPRMDRPRCYVASPLGFTEGGRYYYDTVYLPSLAAIIEPVDPWSLTSPDEVMAAQAAGRVRDMSLEIGRRNISAIRSSDLVVAYLEGQEPDAGTVGEVGFAAALGLPCFGLRTDFRQAGEGGVVINLQIETFIVESGGKIYSSLDELLAGLRAFAATPALA